MAVGVAIFWKDQRSSENKIEIGSLSVSISTPSLVIFIVGALVFVFPFTEYFKRTANQSDAVASNNSEPVKVDPEVDPRPSPEPDPSSTSALPVVNPPAPGPKPASPKPNPQLEPSPQNEAILDQGYAWSRGMAFRKKGESAVPCRVVGDDPSWRIQCGDKASNLYNSGSIPDMGYGIYRKISYWRDKNNDGFTDFCTMVGDSPPFLRCYAGPDFAIYFDEK